LQFYQRCLVDRHVVTSSDDREEHIQVKVNTTSAKIINNIKSSIFKVFTLTAVNHIEELRQAVSISLKIHVLCQF
jgi:hypothetical protein